MAHWSAGPALKPILLRGLLTTKITGQESKSDWSNFTHGSILLSCFVLIMFVLLQPGKSDAARYSAAARTLRRLDHVAHRQFWPRLRSPPR